MLVKGSRLVFLPSWMEKFFRKKNRRFIAVNFNDFIHYDCSIVFDDSEQSVSEEIQMDRLDDFNEYLSEINQLNCNLYWWAHNCTAKNLLSSPLINRMLALARIVEFVENNPSRRIFLFGATLGQVLAIRKRFLGSSKVIEGIVSLNHCLSTIFIIRNFLYLVGDILLAGSRGGEVGKKFELGILTYIDSSRGNSRDPYFGEFLSCVKKQASSAKIAYLAYIYQPIRKKIKMLDAGIGGAYLPIFNFLGLRDYFWAFRKTIIQIKLIPKYYLSKSHEYGSLMEPVFREVLFEELSRGYFQNLLMFRAGLKISKEGIFKKIIYPFENKALEKWFLWGLRYYSTSNIKAIGFQHTSITPRHLCFKLSENEASEMPFPDLIFTIGAVTKNWLIEVGGFPEEKIKMGYALRQSTPFCLKMKDFSSKPIKVLLVLSSSLYELMRGVSFIKRMLEISPELDLGIRAHPDFPLSRLPKDLLTWVKRNVKDLSGKSMHVNFEWAHVVLYISSTVAIEALLNEIPVIRLNIDTLSADPLLGSPSYRWFASAPQECIHTIGEIFKISEKDRLLLSCLGLEYGLQYFNFSNVEMNAMVQEVLN